MIIGLSKIHIQWMLEDMERREEKAGDPKTFMDYSYREISKALKDYFGRQDDYCVLYTIQDKESLMVLNEKHWIRIHFVQIKDFLQD